jgi:hypothetical protein
VNTTVADTAAQWTPEIQRQIDRALADPSGSKVLQAEIEVGDLGSPAAREQLTAAAKALVARVPGHGS